MPSCPPAFLPSCLAVCLPACLPTCSYLQVFNTYGHLSTASLLHRYGFTEPLVFDDEGENRATELVMEGVNRGGVDTVGQACVVFGCSEEEVRMLLRLQGNPFDLVNVDVRLVEQAVW